MTLADYVEAAILIEAANRPQEIAQVYTDWATVVANLKSLVGAQVPDEVIESLMNRFLDEGVAEVVQDQFAGDYYKLNYEQLVESRDRNLVDGSSLVFKYGLVGNQFLHNAIAKFSSDDFDISRPQLDQPEARIPASDRVVSLDHNQVNTLDEPTSELISAVERENAIPDSPGVRELIIGQLKAGRELIRVGVFKVELLYATLVIGLKMLIEKYQDHAIAALASKLLDLVLQQVGID